MNARRQRFQFGLRRLLLWTVAVVPYLAVVRLERWDVASFAAVTTWMLAVGAARVAFGPEAAGALSTLAGAIVGGCVGWFIFGPMGPPSAWSAVFMCLAFCVFGCVLFGVVEAAVLAVNWADDLLARPTTDASAACPADLPDPSTPPHAEEPA